MKPSKSNLTKEEAQQIIIRHTLVTMNRDEIMKALHFIESTLILRLGLDNSAKKTRNSVKPRIRKSIPDTEMKPRNKNKSVKIRGKTNNSESNIKKKPKKLRYKVG